MKFSKNPSMRRAITRRLIGYPLFFGVLYLVACFWLAHTYLSPPRHVPNTPGVMRDVTLPTSAGPDPAWATPGLADGHPKGKLVFVLAHGYGGTRATWDGFVEDLQRAGYEAVAPAMPGHDASPDTTVGFGFKEADVVVDAVRWARSRYPAAHQPRIILMGVSLGGSACWLASERIPDQVDAVITEGAFARFDKTVDYWFERILPHGSTLFRPVVLMAGAMGGIDPNSIRPVDAAAKWRKPALVMEGGFDVTISRPNADQLSAAAHCPLWVVPNALHARCYQTDRKGYVAHVLAVARSVGG